MGGWVALSQIAVVKHKSKTTKEVSSPEVRETETKETERERMFFALGCSVFVR